MTCNICKKLYWEQQKLTCQCAKVSWLKASNRKIQFKKAMKLNSLAYDEYGALRLKPSNLWLFSPYNQPAFAPICYIKREVVPSRLLWKVNNVNLLRQPRQGSCLAVTAPELTSFHPNSWRGVLRAPLTESTSESPWVYTPADEAWA